MSQPRSAATALHALITFGTLTACYLGLSGGRVAVVTDLPQDYTSARALLHGGDPYESLFTLQPKHGLDPPPGDVMVKSNPHPPVAVLITLPYAGLDYDTALRAVQWTQLVILALVWAVCFEVFRPPLPGWAWALAGGLLGLWSPVWQGVMWGQPVGLLAAGTLLLWVLARSERPFAFGLALVAVTLVRPFVAIHIVQTFGWNRRQQFRMAAGMLVGGIVPFALLGITPWDWYRLAQDASGYVPWCGSVPGVLGLGAAGGQVLYAVVAMLLGWFRWRGLSADATAALAATAAMLAYPLAWYYYDPSLLPVVAWVTARAVPTGNRAAAWGLVGYLTLRTIPNMVVAPGGQGLGQVLAENQAWLQVTGRALLLLAVVATARTRPVSASGPS
ncbi:hypothetical protein [Gemmata sp.]|uniref:hypothetical protein n=1 Tax=Gemmata sp. TaxID=1914242 RepID=UPI003F705850